MSAILDISDGVDEVMMSDRTERTGERKKNSVSLMVAVEMTVRVRERETSIYVGVRVALMQVHRHAVLSRVH